MTVKKGKIDLSKVITAEDRARVTKENLEETVRRERDQRLNDVIWIRDRHRDEADIVSTLQTHNLNVILQGSDKPTHDVPDTTINEGEYRELIWYIQDLRNVPQQTGFPENVDWPEKPAFLNT